jgi:uncharacterized membrane protein YfcA
MQPMGQTVANYLWLCGTAFVAGGINALAGGGTLLTFPSLVTALAATHGAAAKIFANGTSTMALMPASLGSAWGFRRELGHLRSLLLWLLPPSIVGGAVGSLLVTKLDPKYFSALVPWLILAATILFLLQPILARWMSRKSQSIEQSLTDSGLDKVTTMRLALMAGLQFVIGIYGGYFGAGIGILMLSGLGLMGLRNMHQMNGLKAVLAAAINGVAIAVFVLDRKVVWTYAVAMMATSLVGGYVAAYYSRFFPSRYIRWVVIAIGFCLATYFFTRP